MIRQLLARPLSVYPKIIATARRLEQGELAELAEGSDGRLVRLGVEDIGDVEAVQVGNPSFWFQRLELISDE